MMIYIIAGVAKSGISHNKRVNIWNHGVVHGAIGRIIAILNDASTHAYYT
jgi:hypothetical protein